DTRRASSVADPDASTTAREAGRIRANANGGDRDAGTRANLHDGSVPPVGHPDESVGPENVERHGADLHAQKPAGAERNPDDFARVVARDPYGRRPDGDSARRASDPDTRLDAPARVDPKQRARPVDTDPHGARASGDAARRLARRDDNCLGRPWRGRKSGARERSDR